MPEPIAASPVTAAPAATLATGDATPTPAPGAPAPAAAPAAAPADDAAVKAAADAKAKEEADAKAEADRVAKLTPEQRKAEEDVKAKAAEEAKAKEAAERAKRAPEKYSDFSLPEGFKLDAEASAKFGDTARKFGLTQEEAQELMTLHAAEMQRGQTTFLTDVDALQNSWLTTSNSDPEIAGAENVATARRAMRFASPELKQLLNETKLGNHPELIRWMHRVGKAMSEDGFVRGGNPGARDDSEAARAKRMYPNQN